MLGIRDGTVEVPSASTPPFVFPEAFREQPFSVMVGSKQSGPFQPCNLASSDKPRVLYAARKLHFLDIEQLKSKLEMALYTCGSSLQDLSVDGCDPVMSKIFVRANVSCSDPVEIPYYSSGSFLDVCIQCGTSDDL